MCEVNSLAYPQTCTPPLTEENQDGKNVFYSSVPYFFPLGNDSDMELVPARQDDQPNVTPDSSTTVNSKSDLDNSMMMFQVMLIVYATSVPFYKLF